MSKSHGISINGILLGMKRVERGNYKGAEIGIELHSPNGFGGVKAETFIVSCFSDDADSLQSVIASHQGKLVSCPLSIRLYQGRNGSQIQYNFDNSRALMPVDESSVFDEQPKKASIKAAS